MADVEAAAARQMVLSAGFLEGRPQPVEKPVADHLRQRPVGLAGRRLEEPSGVTDELNDLQAVVDDHARRRIALEQEPLDLGLRGRRPRDLPRTARRGDASRRLPINRYSDLV